MKTIFCLTKSLSPSQYDDRIQSLKTHMEENNKVPQILSKKKKKKKEKLPDSNEIHSLKDKLELAINERLLTVLLRNF